MPTINDIFTGDAFGVVTLSSLVNNQPFTPGQVGALGLFDEEGVTTTMVGFDLIDGAITLVAPTPRGGPGETVPKDRAKTTALVVPHFQRDDAVYADEVQGRRQLGEAADQVETVQNLVTMRSMKHFRDFDVTIEHQRMGALNGIVLDKDTNVMYNLFTTFGVAAQDPVFFDLSAASPANGVLRDNCDSVIETIENALGADSYDHIHAIAGRTFYKKLIKHKEVTESFKNTIEANFLRQGLPRKFEFGNIVFERYRTGGVSGLIGDDEVRFFPAGTPGLFKTFFAPADYEETVNTVGIPRYVKQYPMPNDKGRNLEVQTNPLNICRKPRTLVTGQAAAS
jgi:hypothetical protein